MKHVSCCAATYDSVRGAGRHLAACLGEDPHELPQVVMTRILKKASRFRNNNNTQMDHEATVYTRHEDFLTLP